jgi:hypothetical protein
MDTIRMEHTVHCRHGEAYVVSRKVCEVTRVEYFLVMVFDGAKALQEGLWTECSPLRHDIRNGGKLLYVYAGTELCETSVFPVLDFGIEVIFHSFSNVLDMGVLYRRVF